MSWFKRPKPKSAVDRLRSRYFCKSCGTEHAGLMDLAAFAPDPWPHAQEREPNSALRFEGDFLSEDLCILEGRYFIIRAVLEIPVHGLEARFGFGCWSTLSRANFDKYIAGFDSGDFTDWGPWSGWLCNRLADYIGDEPEPVLVYPQPDRQRPKLQIANDHHPLAIAQEEGVSPDRLLEILDLYGHAPP